MHDYDIHQLSSILSQVELNRKGAIDLESLLASLESLGNCLQMSSLPWLEQFWRSWGGAPSMALAAR